MTALLSLLLATAMPSAHAGKPKDLPVVGPSDMIPVQPVALADMARSPMCLTGGGGDALPTLTPCEGPVARMMAERQCADGATGLLCAPDAVPSTARTTVFGLFTYDPSSVGLPGKGSVVYATDHAVHAVVRYDLAGPTEARQLDDTQLDALARTCRTDDLPVVAYEVMLGCAKTQVLPRRSLRRGPLRIKDGFVDVAPVGGGTFVTDLDKDPTVCDPDQVAVIGVRTTSLEPVCTTAILPEALRRRDQIIADCRTLDDVVSAAMRVGRQLEAAQGADAARLAEARRLATHLDRAHEALATAELRYANLEDEDDDTMQRLLTELERLQAELEELRVDQASLVERLEGRSEERTALDAKLTAPTLDVPALTRIEREIRSYAMEGEHWAAELSRLRGQVDALLVDTAALQGRIDERAGPVPSSEDDPTP